MNPIRILPLLIIFCFLCAPSPLRAGADPVRFKRLSQGLSQSTVNAILQDRRGFMWFGTQDGLNRFDGYAFTVYRHDPSDPNSIHDNYIWTMAEDAVGDLWIGTLNGGLSRYSPGRGEFRTYVHDSSSPSSLSDNNVTALCTGADGAVIVGTWGGGLQRFDRTNNRFTQIPLGDKRVRCLVADRSGTVWVGTWNGLEVIDSSGAHASRYVHDPRDPGSVSGDRIISLYKDRAGTMWVGTFDAGLNRFDRATNTFMHFPRNRETARAPGSDEIRCIGGDRRGRLWIGTLNAGVDCYDPAAGTFTHYRSREFDPDGLSSDRVFSIFEDRAGAVWFGTGDAGVNRYDPLAHSIAHIKRDPSDAGSLSNNVVRAVLQDARGELWVGTFGGGLNRRLPGRSGFIHYRHEPGRPASLASDAVVALFEDSRHDLWIGTADAGLDLFERESGTFRHFRHDRRDSSSISSDAVMTFTEDRAGDLWIGTSGGGADRFSMSTGKFLHFLPGRGEAAGGNDVWAIHEDRSGSLWMGTWGEGLNRLDGVSHAVAHFVHDPGKSGTLSNNTVWSIYEDAAGTLWLGTWGGGLNRLDPATGTFRAYTETDGLPNNVVYGILPDGKGNLWLSTNKGIAKFSIRAGTFRSYDVLDGLQADEFNQGAYCRGTDGTLYFGGVNGLSAFHPDSLSDNPDPPPVVITGFQVFNRPVFTDAVPGPDDRITLPYGDNFFSFEFAALDYTAPEKNRYAYRLEGFDRDWVYAGTRRYVSYTHLSGGDYVFHVTGSNSDGIWNQEGISLRVHIDPPFYQTWWFLLAVASCIAGGTYFSYRVRLVKLLDLEKLRTRIASDLHDDIGSGLTRIAVLSDVALQQAETLQKAGGAGPPAGPSGVTHSIRKVGNIARELVDAMSDVVWSIDPRHDTAGSLMQRVKVYAFEMCEAKNIALSFETPSEGDSAGLSPEVMRELLLVAKEAVTNIVKHSGCSRARIRLVTGRKEISLEVEDDGRGFAPFAADGGNGLINMKGRAERAGGTFTVESAPGRGTRIHLTLPNV